MEESSILLKESPKPELSDDLLLAEWAVEDTRNLYHFARNTLGFDRLCVQPHADLADFITNTGKYEGRLQNKWKLILLPRGTYKTTVAAIAYPLWLLIRNPNLRILIDSETYAKAVDTLRAIKGLITTRELFRQIHGPLNEPLSKEAIQFASANRGLTWNEDAILAGCRTDFSKKETSISVGGVDIVKVGMHYDVVIGDDYHSEKNVTTREQIDKVIQHIQLMSSILDPGATYIIIGTRWDDKDAYGWIIDELEGLAIRQPGVFKGKLFDIMVHPWRWPDEPGGTLFAPTILNDDTIAPLRKIHSPYSFACQYRNDPVDNESAVFQESWVKNNIAKPKSTPAPHFILPSGEEVWMEELAIFTSVDPAISLGERADYTAIVTIAYDRYMRRYFLDAQYGRWNEDKLVDEVINVYNRWRSIRIGFESVGGFDAFRSIFRERSRKRGIFLPINFFKRDTRISKDTRIRALAPIFESGGFYVVAGAKGLDEFWEEYRRFPRAKHDDVLDAIADIERIKYFPSDPDEGTTRREYKPMDEVTGY